MHARHRFLGMKLTQNGVHKFNESERQHVHGSPTQQDTDTRDHKDPDGSKVQKKSPW